MKKHKKFPSPIERYREESKVSENSFACDCVDDFFFVMDLLATLPATTVTTKQAINSTIGSRSNWYRILFSIFFFLLLLLLLTGGGRENLFFLIDPLCNTFPMTLLQAVPSGGDG